MEAFSGLGSSDRRPGAISGPVASFRREPAYPPSIVLVGASTGGPQALIELLSGFGPALPYVSICVTLHMPPALVPVIAAHVARKCQLSTSVVTEPLPLSNGVVHFAPGDRHLTFARAGAGFAVAPKAEQVEDFCKPAVDTMFASAAAAYGSRTLAIVLSGMGTDGLAGARAIVATGGAVLVQDKQTSAVWGMPGAVAKANLAAAVLAPHAMGKELIRRLRVGERRP